MHEFGIRYWTKVQWLLKVALPDTDAVERIPSHPLGCREQTFVSLGTCTPLQAPATSKGRRSWRFCEMSDETSSADLGHMARIMPFAMSFRLRLVEM
ncbi:hypothetical protein J8I87_29800 [Paraburkholderia sp. LEh10]|uniref:hypothetical protein n=1 Tax=Paraburkholderia sp. LEh10 TaxID=2821353 RepID=UPI001AEA9A0A|nr:hypothetical protein [Paraburkholderia sp. LEh10]MBP0593806.1 hypothetical protein [Paraburkholderia sp. LEh10]